MEIQIFHLSQEMADISFIIRQRQIWSHQIQVLQIYFYTIRVMELREEYLQDLMEIYQMEIQPWKDIK